MAAAFCGVHCRVRLQTHHQLLQLESTLLVQLQSLQPQTLLLLLLLALAAKACQAPKQTHQLLARPPQMLHAKQTLKALVVALLQPAWVMSFLLDSAAAAAAVSAVAAAGGA